VPFGLVGGRLYHVVTDHQLYFGEGRNPIDALKIWNGGLGIWGAIALGAVGAWIGCRRMGVPLPAWADAVAPGIALAQACGRWGNWFNQELFGRPTTLPWGLEIDYAHRPVTTQDLATYHPTFLYESLWCIGVAILVIWADRRFHLGHGRVFALYVAAYTVGRFWIEYLRVDPAHTILGLRLNDWMSMVVFVGAATSLVLSARLRPGRETDIDPAARNESAATEDDAGPAETPTADGGSQGADAAPADGTRRGEQGEAVGTPSEADGGKRS
jgi:prolipoprotein diacylglyceryl transferase